jgi:hypothetical protein
MYGPPGNWTPVRLSRISRQAENLQTPLPQIRSRVGSQTRDTAMRDFSSLAGWKTEILPTSTKCLHVAAHCSQLCAQALICSSPENCSHSRAHFSQTSAQRTQAASAYSESRRRKLAVARQISAHSSRGRARRNQRRASSCSAKLWRAFPQVMQQSKHLSMQARVSWVQRLLPFRFMCFLPDRLRWPSKACARSRSAMASARPVANIRIAGRLDNWDEYV